MGPNWSGHEEARRGEGHCHPLCGWLQVCTTSVSSAACPYRVLPANSGAQEWVAGQIELNSTGCSKESSDSVWTLRVCNITCMLAPTPYMFFCLHSMNPRGRTGQVQFLVIFGVMIIKSCRYFENSCAYMVTTTFANRAQERMRELAAHAPLTRLLLMQ